MILGADFPPLSHIVNWPEFFGDDTWGVNKIVLVYAAAALITMLIFTLGRKGELVPTGAQNLAEIAVEFVEEGIVMETIGEKGLKYTPLLVSLFFFIFLCNITGIIPVIQMPATARIALPMFLALLTYVIYHGAGFKEHGLGYLKHATMPPGLPKVLYILVTPIEFIIKFLVTPFTHTVRLFANLLAGHILLVTFAVLCSALWAMKPNVVILPLPFFALIAFTAFEVLVAFLQAYVFTLLAGVYIGQAVSHEH